nr:hypothetical protein [Tanacetum cinerariifolium]
MNDSMIELRETFQRWLQQQEQVVNLDSYIPEPSQCRKIPIYYDEEESSIPLRDGNGYSEKGQKRSQNGQNRAQNGKA